MSARMSPQVAHLGIQVGYTSSECLPLHAAKVYDGKFSFGLGILVLDVILDESNLRGLHKEAPHS